MRKKLFIFLMCSAIVTQVCGCGNILKNKENEIEKKEKTIASDVSMVEDDDDKKEIVEEAKVKEDTKTDNKENDIIEEKQDKNVENSVLNKNEIETEKETMQEEPKIEELETETKEESKQEQVLGEVETAYTSSTMELEVLNYMNEYRIQNGLPALTYNANICDCAKKRAEEALVNWSHTRPDGREFWTVFKDCNKTINNVVGENLANKFTDTKRIVDLLMNSESHRANILNGRFKSVSIVIIPNGNGKYCMAQLFMG